ncbi:MAG: alpha-amylase family glycosyl hydrolase [Arenimonas sp.]
MPHSHSLATLLAFALHASSAAATAPPTPRANATDLTVASTYESRESDWRNGAIVYQVLVDRFAPAADLDAKRALYPAPKRLRNWNELPTRGTYLPEAKLWSHEIDFWGGDLASLRSRLDYVDDLGADVLYLGPIHLAYTNHKYDALDYLAISPEFGTRADFDALVGDVHGRGMKLVLDGVFNHMGRNAPRFLDAQADPSSPYRDWFDFDAKYDGGVRAWAQAQNLPELVLENPEVRDYLYAKPDSVVQGYLAAGVDGWRLDVAYDIGFAYLGELTAAAHARKPGSLVVGEIANYPREWFPHVDAVMDFSLRQVLLRTVQGEIAPRHAMRMIGRMIDDAGIEPMLKSWLYLDNHDTARLATTLPDRDRRRLAQVLQFTLPGSPNLYYGSELGLLGAGDPEMRAPMPWDRVEGNAELAWTRQLIQLRRQHRALRIGDYRELESDRLLAFERHTDRIVDAVIVLANPGAETVTETVLVPDSKLMNSHGNTGLRDLLDAAAPPVEVLSALVRVTLAPGQVRVLAPVLAPREGYTPYKRVQ